MVVEELRWMEAEEAEGLEGHLEMVRNVLQLEETKQGQKTKIRLSKATSERI